MKQKYSAPQLNVVEIETGTLLAASEIPVGGNAKPKGLSYDYDELYDE